MNDEFEKFQALRPTSHVILYIHMPIHEVYASLIKDFDTYWKKVVPMESFMFFTNDCCGKKIVDVIQPVQYSISSTVLFTSTFILNDFTKNPNTFDQIKKRNWQGSNYTAIDVISNKEKANISAARIFGTLVGSTRRLTTLIPVISIKGGISFLVGGLFSASTEMNTRLVRFLPSSSIRPRITLHEIEPDDNFLSFYFHFI